MTREEMVKRRWQAYETLIYRHPRYNEDIKCHLNSIDFDNEMVDVTVIEGEWEPKDFSASISLIHAPLRMVAKKIPLKS